MGTGNLKAALLRGVRWVGSLKVAMPLLVLTIVVTTAGSLFPDPGFYYSGWYQALLGMLGISLLFITVLHLPAIGRRRGRQALIGVVAAHLGILVLIAGAIYGSAAGFRYQARVIEAQPLVIPGLPFVVRLDELVIEEYPEQAFAHLDLELLPRKRQDSHLTLLRQGEEWRTVVAAPGAPGDIDGIRILPSIADVGWVFDLVLTDPDGLTQRFEMRPWNLRVLNIAGSEIVAHEVADDRPGRVQILTRRGENVVPLGLVTQDGAVELGGHLITVERFRRYSGLTLYYRPHMPVLAAGVLLLMLGLVWHFIHRYQSVSNREQSDV